MESREDHSDWTRERVTFAAAYGDERVIAYLFLPKTAAPPFQAVLYWPGGYAYEARSSDELDDFNDDGPGRSRPRRARRGVSRLPRDLRTRSVAVPELGAEQFKDLSAPSSTWRPDPTSTPSAWPSWG